jgi:hypothetical protein
MRAVRAAFAGAAWDCRTCNAELRRLRNCRGNTNPNFRTVLGPEVLTRCPSAAVTPLSRALLARWRRMKLFGAYAKDGVGDWPEFAAQAMEAIEDAMTEEEAGSR